MKERDPVLLKARLAAFLETHLGTRIPEVSDGALRMHILAAKANRNTKPVEKLINYKLLRLNERLLDGSAKPESDDLVICDFLISELEQYVARRK